MTDKELMDLLNAYAPAAANSSSGISGASNGGNPGIPPWLQTVTGSPTTTQPPVQIQTMIHPRQIAGYVDGEFELPTEKAGEKIKVRIDRSTAKRAARDIMDLAIEYASKHLDPIEFEAFVRKLESERL